MTKKNNQKWKIFKIENSSVIYEMTKANSSFSDELVIEWLKYIFIINRTKMIYSSPESINKVTSYYLKKNIDVTGITIDLKKYFSKNKRKFSFLSIIDAYYKIFKKFPPMIIWFNNKEFN